MGSFCNIPKIHQIKSRAKFVFKSFSSLSSNHFSPFLCRAHRDAATPAPRHGRLPKRHTRSTRSRSSPRRPLVSTTTAFLCLPSPPATHTRALLAQRRRLAARAAQRQAQRPGPLHVLVLLGAPLEPSYHPYRHRESRRRSTTPQRLQVPLMAVLGAREPATCPALSRPISSTFAQLSATITASATACLPSQPAAPPPRSALLLATRRRRPTSSLHPSPRRGEQ